MGVFVWVCWVGGDEGVKWAPEIGDEWKFVAHEWPTDDEESAHTDSEQDEE